MTVFGIIAFGVGWLVGGASVLIAEILLADDDDDDMAEAEWLRAIEEGRG